MRYFFLAVLFAAFSLSAAPPDRTVAGIYMAPNADLPSGFVRVSLARMADPEFKQKFWEQHRQLREEGKREFCIMQLNFSRPQGWKYKLPPLDEAKKQLDDFFRSDAEAQTWPELIYAVTPDEENVNWGGQVELMNQIYDYVTATYGVKVFQWLSEPLDPQLNIRADGWVMDAYGIQGEKFFRHLQKFVLYGKPVFPVLWAAEPHHNYYQNGIEEIFKNVGPKMDYCAELDLPIILYAVSGKKEGFGSVNIWLHSKDSPYAELRGFFYGKLAEIKEGKFNRAEHPLTPVKAVPNKQGKYEEKILFNKFAFAANCRIQNVHALQVTEAGLKANTDGAVLEWLWESPQPVSLANLQLSSEGPVELALFTDGKPAREPLRNFRQLRVQLTPRAGAVLKDLALNADVPFSVNPPTEWTGSHQETFKDDSFMADWHYRDAPTFGSGPRGLGISPRPGHAAQWNAYRHFRAATPVQGLELSVQCRADIANWASSIVAGISLDGKNIRWSEDTAKLDRKLKTFNLKIPARFDSPAAEFFVHLQLRDGSGAKSKNITASIQSITLKELDR